MPVDQELLQLKQQLMEAQMTIQRLQQEIAALRGQQIPQAQEIILPPLDTLQKTDSMAAPALPLPPQPTATAIPRAMPVAEVNMANAGVFCSLLGIGC